MYKLRDLSLVQIQSYSNLSISKNFILHKTMMRGRGVRERERERKSGRGSLTTWDKDEMRKRQSERDPRSERLTPWYKDEVRDQLSERQENR